MVGAPTEVYARVARGAMACWFGTSGPLKANYIYHAEAEPAAQGGKAEIVIHERDRTIDNPQRCAGFHVGITKDGEATLLGGREHEAPRAPGEIHGRGRAPLGAPARSGAPRATRAGSRWEPQPPEATHETKKSEGAAQERAATTRSALNNVK